MSWGSARVSLQLRTVFARSPTSSSSGGAHGAGRTGCVRQSSLPEWDCDMQIDQNPSEIPNLGCLWRCAVPQTQSSQTPRASLAIQNSFHTSVVSEGGSRLVNRRRQLSSGNWGVNHYWRSGVRNLMCIILDLRHPFFRNERSKGGVSLRAQSDMTCKGQQGLARFEICGYL
jgi:hypothetical protein